MLSEILATALDNRPELKQRLSSLLSHPKTVVSGRETMKQRREKAKEMFTAMNLKEKLNK